MLTKITDLINSLQTITESFPDAEFELGFCNCCIHIVIDGKKVGILNIEEDRFEYTEPPPRPPEWLSKAIKRHFGVE